MILAGGRGSRLGGCEKGELEVGGRRLIDIVAGAALGSGCAGVIVVGDVTADGAVNVREQPRFGGPVAGLAAALPKVRSPWVLLLACDLPRAEGLCHLLFAAAGESEPEADGLVVRAEGRRQWLAGLYRRSALEGACAGRADVRHASLRDLMAGLELRDVEDPDGLSRDIDTPLDLRDARKRKEVA